MYVGCLVCVSVSEPRATPEKDGVANGLRRHTCVSMYVSEVRLVRTIFVRIAASTDCKFCNSTMKNQINKLSALSMYNEVQGTVLRRCMGTCNEYDHACQHT